MSWIAWIAFAGAFLALGIVLSIAAIYLLAWFHNRDKGERGW